MPFNGAPLRTSSMPPKPSEGRLSSRSATGAALDFSQLLLELEETQQSLDQQETGYVVWFENSTSRRPSAGTQSLPPPPKSSLPQDPLPFDPDDENAIFTGSESDGYNSSYVESDVSSTDAGDDEDDGYLSLTKSYQYDSPVTKPKKIMFSDVNQEYSADEMEDDGQESPQDIDLPEDDVQSFDSNVAQVDSPLVTSTSKVDQPVNFLQISLENHATFDDILGKLDKYIHRRRTKDFDTKKAVQAPPAAVLGALKPSQGDLPKDLGPASSSETPAPISKSQNSTATPASTSIVQPTTLPSCVNETKTLKTIPSLESGNHLKETGSIIPLKSVTMPEPVNETSTIQTVTQMGTSNVSQPYSTLENSSTIVTLSLHASSAKSVDKSSSPSKSTTKSIKHQPPQQPHPSNPPQPLVSNASITSVNPARNPPPIPSSPTIQPRLQSRMSVEARILQDRRRKMDSMLEKMGDAEIKRITSKIYVGDASTFKTVVVTSLMSADYIVADVVTSMQLEQSNQWCLFELCNDFNIERPIRDWEVVVDIMSSWDSADSVNAIVMKKYSLKDSVSPGASFPKIQGWMYFEHKPGKWQKRFFFLKDTVLCYYKDASSESETMFCHINNFDVYTLITKSKKKMPTEFCFALRSTSPLSFFQSKNDYIKYLCVEKSERLFDWVLAIRLAKNEDMFQRQPELFQDYEGIMSDKAWKRVERKVKTASPKKRPSLADDDEPLIKLAVNPPISRDYQKGTISRPKDKTLPTLQKTDRSHRRKEKETRAEKEHRRENEEHRRKPRKEDSDSERPRAHDSSRSQRRTKESDTDRDVRRRDDRQAVSSSSKTRKPSTGWKPPKPLVDMKELRNSSCLKCGCSETRTYNSGLCINCYHIHATGESGI